MPSRLLCDVRVVILLFMLHRVSSKGKRDSKNKSLEIYLFYIGDNCAVLSGLKLFMWTRLASHSEICLLSAETKGMG